MLDRSYAWMLLASAAFAAMALLAESLREQFSFPWIAMVRSAIAALLALILAVVAGAKLVVFRPKSLWLRSIAGWAALICGFYAFTHYEVSIALALTNMYPIWVSVLGWPMLGHRPTWNTWLALAISTMGVWLVYGQAVLFGGTNPTAQSSQGYRPELAIPLAIAAGVFSGFALIGLHKIRAVDSRAIVLHFSAVATLFCLVAWSILPALPAGRPIDALAVAALLAVGLLATLGQLSLTKAFQTGVPARVSVVGLSQVAWAVLAKWYLQGRAPSAWSCVGMGMIVGATILVMMSESNPKDPVHGSLEVGN